MERFDIGKITGQIVLFTKSGLKKDGTLPVKARITHERNKAFFGLGFDLTDDQFERLFKVDPGTGKPYKLGASEKTLKKFIEKRFEPFFDYVQELEQNGGYSHEKLRKRLQKGSKEFLNTAFENKIQELKKELQVGTAASYTTAKNFFAKYSPDVRFVDISETWLQNFERWALYKVGINETSLGIYLRYLRALFNAAIKAGDITPGTYPFDNKIKAGYKMPQGTGTKTVLTVEQVSTVAKLELTGSLERCRDMFLLSFHLGGINFADLLQLKHKNIANNKVSFVRAKTAGTSHKKKDITVPFTEPAKRILARWGNPDKRGESFVIDHLTDQMTLEQKHLAVKSFVHQVNDQLKKIGAMAGIQGLTTYVARHTFATVMKNSGAPVAFIGEILGHTSTKTTESYLHGFEDEQKRKHFEKIANIG